MSSMRVLNRMLQAGKSNDCYFLVEWDEPGRPHSIILSRNLLGSTDGVKKGDTVEVKAGKSVYSAVVLGYGKLP